MSIKTSGTRHDKSDREKKKEQIIQQRTFLSLLLAFQTCLVSPCAPMIQ